MQHLPAASKHSSGQPSIWHDSVTHDGISNIYFAAITHLYLPAVLQLVAEDPERFEDADEEENMMRTATLTLYPTHAACPATRDISLCIQ
jgi:hypothetical protein